MRKKKINYRKTIDKFTIKPLFDDSDIYETREKDNNTSIEQLDKEIEELIKKIKEG